MISKPDRKLTRVKPHMRIRRRLIGSPERPRLCIYRSTNISYALIVDYSQAKTLVCASNSYPELNKLSKIWDREGAKSVCALVAKRAKDKGIKAVGFDRGGYIYHGTIVAQQKPPVKADLTFNR